MQNQLTNPIVQGSHCDPSVCAARGRYYMVTSTFSFFPGIPVLESEDLFNWKIIGHVLTTPSAAQIEDAAYNAGNWATTIRYDGARFYIVVSNVSVARTFFCTADDPAGPWSEPIFVEKIDEAGKVYDPSLDFEDGRCYITYALGTGDNAILMAEIDATDGRLLSEPREIWRGTGMFGIEGPHVYPFGDYYFLLAAAGGNTNHAALVARSRERFGPYESAPHNPVFTNFNERQRLFQSLGHGDFVRDAVGHWWFIFHATRNVGGYEGLADTAGREACIAPVEWQDDWPIVGDDGRLPARYELDREIPEQLPWAFEDDLSTPDWPLEWLFRQPPKVPQFERDTDAREIRLTGNAADLSQQKPGATWCAVRQAFNEGVWQVSMQFDPQQENEEAGISCFMNPDYHYDLLISREAGQPVLVARRQVSDIDYIQESMPVEGEWVDVEVRVNPWAYEFFVGFDGGEKNLFAKMQAHLITRSVAGGFTGVMLSLFATGRGDACSGPVRFKNIAARETGKVVPPHKL
ncbi:MAG: glycoside hydrolase family 43 protein [Candidatus Sumerlaeia bacterium]